MCPVHHGPFDECPDEKRDWFPQRRICWPAAELAVAERMFDALHADQQWHDGTFSNWSDEYSDKTPWHYKDGTVLYLAEYDENPEDRFTTEKNAAPKKSGEPGD